MESPEDQHTRICILEKLFIVFQENNSKHMDKGDLSFVKLGTQLNAIFCKIDAIKVEQVESDRRIVEQLQKTLDRDFVSKKDLEIRISTLRGNIVSDIKESKSGIFSDIMKMVTGFTLALALSGWIYATVLKDMLHS